MLYVYFNFCVYNGTLEILLVWIISGVIYHAFFNISTDLILSIPGTFQKVEYVFLVGVAGGVPHYTDYNKHVRLGDVVVSTPPEGQK